MSEQNKQCPEFPFFCASYPDARCINGYLWDLDKCDENGNLYGEGDIPCPFCNTEEFIEYDPFSKEDEFYEGIEYEEKANLAKPLKDRMNAVQYRGMTDEEILTLVRLLRQVRKNIEEEYKIDI